MAEFFETTILRTTGRWRVFAPGNLGGCQSEWDEVKGGLG